MAPWGLRIDSNRGRHLYHMLSGLSAPSDKSLSGLPPEIAQKEKHSTSALQFVQHSHNRLSCHRHHQSAIHDGGPLSASREDEPAIGAPGDRLSCMQHLTYPPPGPLSNSNAGIMPPQSGPSPPPVTPLNVTRLGEPSPPPGVPRRFGGVADPSLVADNSQG